MTLRLRGSYNVAAAEKTDRVVNLKTITCTVIFLDDTSASFNIEKHCRGQVLSELVFDYLEILERDFFGLVFNDRKYADEPILRWLDQTRSFQKQLRGAGSTTFWFRVKFYVPDPIWLKEEYTRYQFFLQVKKDVLDGFLVAPVDTLAHMAGLCLQGELGDYSADEHRAGYVKEFRFVPMQTAEFDARAGEWHRKLRSLLPVTAELEYLNIARRLELYGIHPHDVTDPNHNQLTIGVGAPGMSTFRDSKRVSCMFWESIFKIGFKKRTFNVSLKPQTSTGTASVMGQFASSASSKVGGLIYEFIFPTAKQAKLFWRLAVTCHTFFRVREPHLAADAHSHFAGFRLSDSKAATISATAAYLNTQGHTTLTRFLSFRRRSISWNASVSGSTAGGLERTWSTLLELRKQAKPLDRDFSRTPPRLHNRRSNSFGPGLNVYPSVTSMTQSLGDSSPGIPDATSQPLSPSLQQSSPVMKHFRAANGRIPLNNNPPYTTELPVSGPTGPPRPGGLQSSRLRKQSAPPKSSFPTNGIGRSLNNMAPEGEKNLPSKLRSSMQAKVSSGSTQVFKPSTLPGELQKSQETKRSSPTRSSVTKSQSESRGFGIHNKPWGSAGGTQSATGAELQKDDSATRRVGRAAAIADEEASEESVTELESPEEYWQNRRKQSAVIPRKASIPQKPTLPGYRSTGAAETNGDGGPAITIRSSQRERPTKGVVPLRTGPTTQSFRVATTMLPGQKKPLEQVEPTKGLEQPIRETIVPMTAANLETSTHSQFVDDGLVTVRIRPDAQGHFGFNVKGGMDHNSPVIVSRVGANMPADTCIPRLNEGDHVLFVNGRDISNDSHQRVVEFIRSATDSHTGELVLVVKPGVYITDYTAGETGDEGLPDTGDAPPLPPRTLQWQKSPAVETAPTSGWSPVTAEEHGPRQQSRNQTTLIVSKNYRGLANKAHTVYGEAVYMSIKELEKSLDDFSALEEFEATYRSKVASTFHTAKQYENLVKNRYRDISPYDQTRVHIREGRGDYINASHVNLEFPKAGFTMRYIAAQGPLSNTCGDFWQMCWEQQTNLIIMVTALVERGRSKCYKYWPDMNQTFEFRFDPSSSASPSSPSASLQPTELHVKTISEEINNDFVSRKFIMSRGPVLRRGSSSVTSPLSSLSPRVLSSSNSSHHTERRHVVQLQYNNWPDHGVPKHPADLITFVQRMKTLRGTGNVPAVVHCSAGIGRTGVIILVETALNLIEARRPVHPIELLRQMRGYRAMLIQTTSQFQFACKAIIEAFNSGHLRSMDARK